MSRLTENQRAQQYYPLLSVGEHEMEGELIASSKMGPDGVPIIELVSGEPYTWPEYYEIRKRWEKEGYLSSDDTMYTFRGQLMLGYTTNQPYPDIEDPVHTTRLWQNAQYMLERSRQPLVVSFLDGDYVELTDWATEMNLVEIIKTDFRDDERFEGCFRLLLEVPGETDEEFEHVDVSILHADNWYLLLNGDMDLNVIVEYLDEEETARHIHQEERAQTPLRFITPKKDDTYTLEEWAYKPFYPEEHIHLADDLQRKYPELREYRLEMYMNIPGMEEHQEISIISQENIQKILEADIPLEVELFRY